MRTETILTLPEAAHFFMKHHAKELPRISVSAAVEQCLAQCRADRKSPAWMRQLEHYLTGFAENMNVEVSELTPGIVSRYLTAMVASERTKKNAREGENEVAQKCFATPTETFAFLRGFARARCHR
jgi:hypothetical protein